LSQNFVELVTNAHHDLLNLSLDGLRFKQKLILLQLVSYFLVLVWCQNLRNH